MTVLCGACGAENRDAAKFCKGCGRKMAQAWPQAASSEDADMAILPLEPAPSPVQAASRRAKAHEALRPTPAPKRARIGNGRWIVGLGLGVVLLVLAAAWWGDRGEVQETARSAAPAPEALRTEQPVAVEAPAPQAPPAVTAVPVAAPALLEPADPRPEPAPTVEPAAPASAKPRKSAPKKQPPPPAPPAAIEAAAPVPVPVPAPARVPTPQESCAGRNFIARAQCMAEQCARPEVSRHPQCDAVRQQQRIEEEKRNPTMAG